MKIVYITVWQGDPTDWITLSHLDPQTTDSDKFDEGKCLGGKCPNFMTDERVKNLQKSLQDCGFIVKVFN